MCNPSFAFGSGWWSFLFLRHSKILLGRLTYVKSSVVCTYDYVRTHLYSLFFSVISYRRSARKSKNKIKWRECKSCFITASFVPVAVSCDLWYHTIRIAQPSKIWSFFLSVASLSPPDFAVMYGIFCIFAFYYFRFIQQDVAPGYESTLWSISIGFFMGWRQAIVRIPSFRLTFPLKEPLFPPRLLLNVSLRGTQEVHSYRFSLHFTSNKAVCPNPVHCLKPNYSWSKKTVGGVGAIVIGIRLVCHSEICRLWKEK